MERAIEELVANERVDALVSIGRVHAYEASAGPCRLLAQPILVLGRVEHRQVVVHVRHLHTNHALAAATAAAATPLTTGVRRDQTEADLLLALVVERLAEHQTQLLLLLLQFVVHACGGVAGWLYER